MAHSWDPKSETSSWLADVARFVITVAIAGGLAFFLVEWLLSTMAVGHPIRRSVTGFEDWLADLDLVLIAAGSVFVFLIWLAFQAQKK